MSYYQHSSVTEENHIIFSRLFFDNHEDIVKLTEYFCDDVTVKNNFQSIETMDIDNIISELGLNTNIEETICILKNVFEINEYVEEEKIADATKGFFPFADTGIPKLAIHRINATSEQKTFLTFFINLPLFYYR